MEISIIDEDGIITQDDAARDNDEPAVGPYASAIGAAQSMAD
jgi:hypothetical protein